MYLIDVIFWGKVGVVCCALIALGTIVGWAYRKVVRPMFRQARRSLRRLNRGMDDLLGEPAKVDFDGKVISPAITSLRSEIISLQEDNTSLKADNTALKADIAEIRRDLVAHLQMPHWPGARAGTLPRRRSNDPSRNGE